MGAANGRFSTILSPETDVLLEQQSFLDQSLPSLGVGEEQREGEFSPLESLPSLSTGEVMAESGLLVRPNSLRFASKRVKDSGSNRR